MSIFYEVWVAGKEEMELYLKFPTLLEAARCANNLQCSHAGTVAIYEVATKKIKF